MKPQDVFVRLMLEEDIPDVLAIEETLPGRQWTEKSFMDSLKRPEAHFYVAACRDEEGLSSYPQGRALAYCGCYCALDEAEIVNVAVAPELRQNGIGRQMVSYVIGEEKKSGTRIFILEVRCSNTAARRLYEKAGFVCCGTRRDFYERPAEDAIVMRLDV